MLIQIPPTPTGNQFLPNPPQPHCSPKITSRGSYIIYSDGGSYSTQKKPHPPSYGSFLIYKNGQVLIHKQLVYDDETNNSAEHRTLFEALSWLVENGNLTKLDRIVVIMDSKLVVNQVLGNWKCKKSNTQYWTHKTQTLIRTQIPKCYFNIEWHPRKVLVEKLGH